MQNPKQDFNEELEGSPGALQRYTLQDWIDADKPVAATVVLAGEDELADHYLDLVGVAKISIIFAGFMDGRGFSHAGKLRQLGFTGELVADGDVMADQWVFLQRCGFDAIQSSDVASNASALPNFSERYQADARELDPLFRRRRSA